MQFYNKIMLWFWLLIGFLTLIVVTVMGFKHGFGVWAFYYIFVLIAFGMYFFRRWMMKRMEKHMKWLEENKKSNN